MVAKYEGVSLRARRTIAKRLGIADLDGNESSFACSAVTLTGSAPAVAVNRKGVPVIAVHPRIHARETSDLV